MANNLKLLINRVSWNGQFYYPLMLKELRLKDDESFRNTNSPFRDDKNPSFSIYRDKKTGHWLYKDWGNGCTGDVFDFAAAYHKLDVRTEFLIVLKKMYGDLRIDEIPDNELDKVLNPKWGLIDFNVPWLTLTTDQRPSGRVRHSSRGSEYQLKEVSFSNLRSSHKTWMQKYGITEEAMKELGACFVSGWVVYYENGSSLNKDIPPTETWIAYKGDHCAKLYCTEPKSFQYVGKKPSKYVFGTKAPFDQETVVLLTGGEKDVLTLKSHGIEAICLNSETEMPTKSFLHDGYFNKGHKLITLFDIDETGTTQADKIHKNLGLPYVTLPAWVREKGGKDVSDFFQFGGAKEELIQLIQKTSEGVDNLCIMPEDKPATLTSSMPTNRLSVRTAQQRIADAANQPEILPHADVLWQKNELVILFGDTGKGKSIAAVSIADAISKGESFLGLENKLPAQRVLYYDFELSDKQFQVRYSNEGGEPYSFSPNFFIDNIDLSKLVDTNTKMKFEEVLLNKFRSDIQDTGAEVVIIDNITFLSTQSPEDSQVALTLMKLLKELKTSMGISVLVLAHTPKKVSTYGITLQDLAGSKHLSNFADGVFALGDVKSEKNVRYLMQVKPSRSGEHKYDKSNVIVCELEKQDRFLTFSFIKTCPEYQLLGDIDGESKDEKVAKIKELKKHGKTIREIAQEVGMSKTTVDRWLNENK